MDESSKTKTYSSVGETKESRVIYMRFIDKQKIIGVTQEGIHIYILKPYGHESNPQLPFTFEAKSTSKLSAQTIQLYQPYLIDQTIQHFNDPIAVYGKNCSIMAKGGFWNGTIVISQIFDQNGQNIIMQAHSSTTLCLVVDQTET